MGPFDLKLFLKTFVALELRLVKISQSISELQNKVSGERDRLRADRGRVVPLSHPQSRAKANNQKLSQRFFSIELSQVCFSCFNELLFQRMWNMH